MILSSQTLQNHVERGIIGIDPEPTADQYQPASLDVRLGNSLYNYETDTEIISTDKLTIEPGTFYLGHTQETVKLPIDVGAQITGRSTIGRKGIVVHKTAGWIDPGFQGEITLEIFNFTSEPHELAVGSRVAQLVCFRCDRPTEGYQGQYQGQAGIETSGSVD